MITLREMPAAFAYGTIRINCKAIMFAIILCFDLALVKGFLSLDALAVQPYCYFKMIRCLPCTPWVIASSISTRIKLMATIATNVIITVQNVVMIIAPLLLNTSHFGCKNLHQNQGFNRFLK